MSTPAISRSPSPTSPGITHSTSPTPAASEDGRLSEAQPTPAAPPLPLATRLSVTTGANLDPRPTVLQRQVSPTSDSNAALQVALLREQHHTQIEVARRAVVEAQLYERELPAQQLMEKQRLKRERQALQDRYEAKWQHHFNTVARGKNALMHELDVIHATYHQLKSEYEADRDAVVSRDVGGREREDIERNLADLEMHYRHDSDLRLRSIETIDERLERLNDEFNLNGEGRAMIQEWEAKGQALADLERRHQQQKQEALLAVRRAQQNLEQLIARLTQELATHRPRLVETSVTAAPRAATPPIAVEPGHRVSIPRAAAASAHPSGHPSPLLHGLSQMPLPVDPLPLAPVIAAGDDTRLAERPPVRALRAPRQSHGNRGQARLVKPPIVVHLSLTVIPPRRPHKTSN